MEVSSGTTQAGATAPPTSWSIQIFFQIFLHPYILCFGSLVNLASNECEGRGCHEEKITMYKKVKVQKTHDKKNKHYRESRKRCKKQNCNFSKRKWKWKRHNAQAQLISKPPLAWNTSFLGSWLRSHCQEADRLIIFLQVTIQTSLTTQFTEDLIEKDFPPDEMSACLKVWAWRHSLSAPFVCPETHSICLYQRRVWCMVHSTEWLVFLSAFYLLVSSRGAYHIYVHTKSACIRRNV